MYRMKRIYVSSIIAVLSLLLMAATNIDTTKKTLEKSFDELQNELNREKHKRKILSRFAELESWNGPTVDEISLELIDYSYHYLNASGKQQPFVTAICRIDISGYQREAEKLRARLISEGKQGQFDIKLPDSERVIFGILDDEKDEFITFAALPNTVKSIVTFAELRKGEPEFIILSLEPDDDCTECWQTNSFSTAVFGFDEKPQSYYNALEVKTYRIVFDSDDLDSGVGYEDRATISWTEWINNQYRELIISTERDSFVSEKEVSPAFKNKQEIYSWANDKELALVERIVDGSVTMSRRGPQPPAPEVALRDGDLYVMDGNDIGDKIIATDGKIDRYMVSPDKLYVACSVIIGYADEPGIYEDGEEPSQRPLHKITITDLKRKKQLREILAPSENDPFFYLTDWISDSELMLTDSDGFAVSWSYVYNVETNELRKASIEEMNLEK